MGHIIIMHSGTSQGHMHTKDEQDPTDGGRAMRDTRSHGCSRGLRLQISNVTKTYRFHNTCGYLIIQLNQENAQ